MGEPTADDSGVAIGTVLAGRYRIGGVLGAGGMGRVYRGEHTSMGKPVAVKVLHAALGRNREAALRFQREAIASGRLDHPNIVSVIDFGVLDDGALYLVMEVLEGEHLGERIAREKRLPWAEALLVIRGVLLGLRHAHDRGVVHRDIKPANIFLAEKDGEAIVKLLDFGIAKIVAGQTDDQNATRAGITVGTPTYLSPEQAVGGAITPAADIYSTSIVLYEMLVGRAPFESEDALTLLTSHAGSEPPAFRDLAPELELPESIEPLVRRGLAKIQAERIGAIEYVREIDEILRAHGIDIPAAPLGPRTSQSIGIPSGPFAASTPSPDFLATPTPFPSLARATTPAPVARTIERAPPDDKPRRRSSRRKWLVLGALGLAGAIALAVMTFARDTTGSPAVVTAPPRRAHAEDAHAAQLQSALRDLQGGATCADRKKALAKLVQLADGKAVPAIKRARARGKPNACLRAAADDAIRALGGRN